MAIWLKQHAYLHDAFIKSMDIESLDRMEDDGQVITHLFNITVKILTYDRELQLIFQRCVAYSFYHGQEDGNTIFEVRGAVTDEGLLYLSFDPSSSDPLGDRTDDNDWIVCKLLKIVECS